MGTSAAQEASFALLIPRLDDGTQPLPALKQVAGAH